MVAKQAHIRRISEISVIVLCAVLTVAQAENPVVITGGNSRRVNHRPKSGTFSSSQKRETAYDILRRTRGQQGVSKTLEVFSTGPVVAKAELRLVPCRRGSPVGFLDMQRQETTPVRPPQLREQPPDAPREPVYFLVDVGEKNVPGITYRSIRGLRKVKLYLDTDGDGLFSDEKEYVGTWLSLFTLTRTYRFGPVSTRHDDTGAKGGSFYADCSDGRWLVFRPAFYREGQVMLDGKAYKIAIIDCDFDGKYNKSFVPPARSSREPECDVLAIDLDGDSKFSFEKPGTSEIMPLSKLICVNNQYYSMDVAADGSTIEFRRAKPQFGTFSIEGKEAQLALWSDSGHQRLSGSGGKWRVPAGKYSMVSLELTETDSTGNRWAFNTDKGGAGQLSDFEIRPGETTSFKIGPPFKVRTFMNSTGGDVLVGFNLKGQADELYVPGATRNGKTVPEPQYKIIDNAGRIADSGQFEFR